MNKNSIIDRFDVATFLLKRYIKFDKIKEIEYNQILVALEECKNAHIEITKLTYFNVVTVTVYDE